MDISFIFSSIGGVLSIMLFAGQVPLMRRLIRVDKDSSRYSTIPSFSTVGNSLMWCVRASGARGAARAGRHATQLRRTRPPPQRETGGMAHQPQCRLNDSLCRLQFTSPAGLAMRRGTSQHG
jgi:hypothetical protein